MEEPGFSGGIRVTAPFITDDPQSGVRNVGMYSGHFRGENHLIAGIAPVHHAMLYHHRSAVSAQESRCRWPLFSARCPILILSRRRIFPMASMNWRSPAAFADGRSTSVPCKTIPLEVPAEAEIVIEGEISIDRKERGEPFSDYPGYLMVERGLRPVIDVKAITMRRDAIFTAILVGLPPSESNGISRTCREMMLYNFLKYSCAMPEVLEVCLPGNGRRLELVGHPHARRAIRASPSKRCTPPRAWTRPAK